MPVTTVTGPVAWTARTRSSSSKIAPTACTPALEAIPFPTGAVGSSSGRALARIPENGGILDELGANSFDGMRAVKVMWAKCRAGAKTVERVERSGESAATSPERHEVVDRDHACPGEPDRPSASAREPVRLWQIEDEVADGSDSRVPARETTVTDRLREQGHEVPDPAIAADLVRGRAAAGIALLRRPSKRAETGARASRRRATGPRRRRLER